MGLPELEPSYLIYLHRVEKKTGLWSESEIFHLAPLHPVTTALGLFHGLRC